MDPFRLHRLRVEFLRQQLRIDVGPAFDGLGCVGVSVGCGLLYTFPKRFNRRMRSSMLSDAKSRSGIGIASSLTAENLPP